MTSQAAFALRLGVYGRRVVILPVVFVAFFIGVLPLRNERQRIEVGSGPWIERASRSSRYRGSTVRGRLGVSAPTGPDLRPGHTPIPPASQTSSLSPRRCYRQRFNACEPRQQAGDRRFVRLDSRPQLRVDRLLLLHLLLQRR